MRICCWVRSRIRTMQKGFKMSFRKVAQVKKFDSMESWGKHLEHGFKNKPTEYEKYRKMMEQRKKGFSEVLSNAEKNN